MSNDQTLLKVVVAEFTEEEHRTLMEILLGNLTHNQDYLTRLKFMEPPECTCGQCDKDEQKTIHEKALFGITKGVALLESIILKLK